MKLRIATRESPLALWQAHFVRSELQRVHPALAVELVPMTTAGDQLLSSPLAQVGGKGLFVKELETAMLEGRADIAVHSMKDVPAVLPDGLVLTGCADTGSGSGDAGSGEGGGSDNLAITFLPKNLGNPYFDTSNAGGEAAIKEFGGSYEQVGPANGECRRHPEGEAGRQRDQ